MEKVVAFSRFNEKRRRGKTNWFFELFFFQFQLVFWRCFSVAWRIHTHTHTAKRNGIIKKWNNNNEILQQQNMCVSDLFSFSQFSPRCFTVCFMVAVVVLFARLFVWLFVAHGKSAMPLLSHYRSIWNERFLILFCLPFSACFLAVVLSLTLSLALPLFLQAIR